MRKAKEKWITEQCKIIDCGMRKSNENIAYEISKFLTQTNECTTNIIECTTGQFLTYDNDVIEMSNYC